MRRGNWISVAQRGAAALVLVALWGAVTVASLSGQAYAITIIMDDVAPDRVERQRAFAEGALPLANTPNLARFTERLAGKGLKAGDPVFLRIFKAESQAEVWMRKGETYVLFDTYPICSWSGTLGPKQREGDKQNPEGFYSISRRQLHWVGRWPRSLDLGFPNTFDRLHGRTGSYLLIHGGCSSVGCYAMTNAVMAEIFELVEQALKKGQPQVEVHVFPFRMTDEHMDRYASSAWADFWGSLRAGYDAFERTRVPPRIGICEKQYVVEPVQAGEAEAVLASRIVKRVSRRSRRAELPTICKPLNDVAVASVPAKAEPGLGSDAQVDAAVSKSSVEPVAVSSPEETAAGGTMTSPGDSVGSQDVSSDAQPQGAQGAAVDVGQKVLAVSGTAAAAGGPTRLTRPLASRAARRVRQAAARAAAVAKAKVRAAARHEYRSRQARSSKTRRRTAARTSAAGPVSVDPLTVFGDAITR